MRLEYSIWNITKGWQPMKATTLEAAADEIRELGPYGEEAKVRDADTGQVFERRRQSNQIHGINCDCCPR